MKSLFVAMTCLLLLAGCARSYKWVGGSGTFSRDDAACEMYANRVYASEGMPYQPEPARRTTYNGSATRYNDRVEIYGTSTTTIDSDQEFLNNTFDTIYRSMNSDEAYGNCMKSKGYRKDYGRSKRRHANNRAGMACTGTPDCMDHEMCDEKEGKCIPSALWLHKYAGVPYH